MWRLRTFAIVALLALIAPAAGAQEFRFSTENDLVTSSPTPDDLYTYSLGFEAFLRGNAITLDENAFTDRAAGIRFDETYLSVGRSVPVPGPWSLHAEAGAVHVGHGLFGERLQNAVHHWCGCDLIHLRYVGSSVRPRIAFDLKRGSASGAAFTAGPRLQADIVPGLRSWALVAADATWHAGADIAIEALVGDRFTHASYAPLRPHLPASSIAWQVGVLFAERVFISWSYDDYGDRREHVTAGYRVPLGGRPPTD